MATKKADPGEVVQALIEAVHRHDPDEIAAFFTDDATCQLVPGSKVEGRDAIRQLFVQFAGMMSDVRVEVHHQVASDSVVMNERTDYLRVGGNSMTLAICGVFEIEGNLIKAWREYYLDPVPGPV